MEGQKDSPNVNPIPAGPGPLYIGPELLFNAQLHFVLTKTKSLVRSLASFLQNSYQVLMHLNLNLNFARTSGGGIFYLQPSSNLPGSTGDRSVNTGYQLIILLIHKKKQTWFSGLDYQSRIHEDHTSVCRIATSVEH